MSKDDSKDLLESKKKDKDKKGRRGKHIDYFSSFEAQCEGVVRQGELVHDLIAEFDPAAATRCIEDAREIEHAVRNERDQMIRAIEEDFITPIEREDLVEIALSIEALSRSLLDVARCVYMYDVSFVDDRTCEMFDLVRSELEVIYEAMGYLREFKKPKRIKEKSHEVAEMVSASDDLFVLAMRELFQDGPDAMQALKTRAVYTSVHDCSEAMRRVGDVMKRIVIKNG